MKNIVYVAGPYTADKPEKIDRNIDIARDACIWLAKHRVFYFSPHLNSAKFDRLTPSVPYSYWQTLYLTVLEQCGAILMLPNWQMSLGSVEEHAASEKIGRPIFYYDDPGMLGKKGILHWNSKVNLPKILDIA